MTYYNTVGYFLVAYPIFGMKHEELWFVESMWFTAYVAEWELLASSNVIRPYSHLSC